MNKAGRFLVWQLIERLHRKATDLFSTLVMQQLSGIIQLISSGKRKLHRFRFYRVEVTNPVVLVVARKVVTKLQNQVTIDGEVIVETRDQLLLLVR